jgi:hypothetical protein
MIATLKHIYLTNLVLLSKYKVIEELIILFLNHHWEQNSTFDDWCSNFHRLQQDLIQMWHPIYSSFAKTEWK